MKTSSRHVRSIEKLLVRESSQVLFFSNRLVSLFSMHCQILLKLGRVGLVIFRAWSGSCNWIDCFYLWNIRVLMAEQQKYLASWQSLPCSSYCRYDIKWVGCTCPWQILAPILPGPQPEPGNELTLPESDIKHHSPTTIKVTGLENLYRKDDKYVSKRNVLFNLRYILISIDCRSTRLPEKSSCHPSMIGIVKLLSIDSWMSMKETLSIWAHGSEW